MLGDDCETSERLGIPSQYRGWQVYLTDFILRSCLENGALIFVLRPLADEDPILLRIFYLIFSVALSHSFSFYNSDHFTV
jgi:hypothetical protein